MTITVSGFAESVYFSGLPTTPSGLTVDPVTGTLFFADFGDANGTLRQLATNKSLSTVTSDFTPGSGSYAYMATDIQFANGFVYTTLSNGDLVQVDTKTATSTILTNFGGFGAEAGLGINGSKLYVTDGTGSANQIWEYDLSTNIKTLKVSNLPSEAYGLEFDLTRNKAYFAVNGSGFYVADLTAGTYRLLASVPSGVGNFAIDPTGNFLYARVANTIQRISVDDGSAITFQTGLMNDDKGDLTFGRSSSGSGSSLYVANGNSIIEVSGFAPLPSSGSSSGSGSSNLPPANFTGTDGNDILPANGANNTGDDTFAPRLGRDYVDGGAGNDLLVVDYSANPYPGNAGPPAGIQSYVSQTGSNSFNGSFRAYKDGYGNYDEVQFSNIERFYVVGTNANDFILGASGNDTLMGNGGNDIIEAGAGNDTINGGLGNDDIRAGDGNDTINAGLGNSDRVDGGNGNDLLIVDYSASVSTSTAPGASGLSLSSYAYPSSPESYSGYFSVYNSSTGQSNQVDFNNIERFQIEGSHLNDYLNGTIAADTINGNSGDDVINAGAGNDTINGGTGNDDIRAGDGDDIINAGLGNWDRADGGSGNDLLIVDYSAIASASSTSGAPSFSVSSYVNANSSGSYSGSLGAYNSSTGQSNGVEFNNIERFQIEGSQFNDSLAGTVTDDTINGNSGNDIIDAKEGNDTINGGTGNDDIRAGDGNDTINAGSGSADRVDGGNGNDLLIVDYLASAAVAPGGMAPSISSQIYANGPNSYVGSFSVYNSSTGQSNRVDFNNIERFQIEGSQSNDNIVGTIAADTINGGLGNDDIRAGDGNDTINAGLGSADRVDGGSGNDLLIVDYLANTNPPPSAPSPSLSNYITANGAGSYSGSFNVYNPNTGQSNQVDFNNIEQFQIEGSQSNDNIMGTIAADIINGNSGDDFIDSKEGNDTINGGLGNDDIRAGDGNDTINAGLGSADRADGGNGNDLLIVDYSAIASANSTSGSPSFSVSNYAYANSDGSYYGAFGVYNSSTGQSNQVSFNNIERFQIEGSQFNDSIMATMADDTINSNSGDDIIEAGLGNDIINGGLGNDDIRAGDGNDTINAGLGSSDRVDGGNGNDLLIVDYSASVSASTAPGASGLNLYSYGSANGYGGYSGSFSVYNSSAGQSNQVSFNNIERFQIEGSQFNDYLNGTMADDIINAGLGGDMLVGGQGNDVLNLGSDTNSDMVQYNNGDGTDTVYQFVRGVGGDQISFSGINYIDVSTIGTTTELRVGDGIQSNAGFGTGTLLIAINGTTGFSANDIGMSLKSTGQFLFS